MEITLVRHPPTVAPADVCIGRSDVACAAGWDVLAEGLHATLEPPQRLYTSPLSRCRVFADWLASRWQLVPVVDARLQELDFGHWEGRRWSEIERADSDPWAADPLNVAPPGGECYGALLARVDDWLAEFGSAEQRIVVVTHAGPVRALLVRLLRLTPDAAWAFEVAHARRTRLARGAAGWRLVTLNA